MHYSTQISNYFDVSKGIGVINYTIDEIFEEIK
jgi:hypothetical protein